jgi:hypothetical protein
MHKDFLEYYRVLNLSPGATPAEIKRSYYQIIRRWHPDLFKPGSLMQKTAEDITKDTNEAFEQLIKKRHYRRFPPPGEASATKPQRQASRRAPAPPRRPRNRSGWRFSRKTWTTAAAAACAVGIASAGAVFRSEALAFFAGPKPVASAVAVAPPAAQVTKERPAGLAAVSIPPATTAGWAPATPAAIGAPADRPASPRVRTLAVVDATGTPARTTAPVFRADVRPGTPVAIAVLPGAAGGTEVSAASPAVAIHSAELGRFLEEATARLGRFDVGDPKARVLEVQGPPDEDHGSVLRYGSSLVYLDKDGSVKGWADRYPRLNIRRWPVLAAFSPGRFSLGSDRYEVIRAQGIPTRFTSYGYNYGTSYIFFENDRVSGFGEGDLPLNSLVMPTLPATDLDQVALTPWVSP